MGDRSQLWQSGVSKRTGVSMACKTETKNRNVHRSRSILKKLKHTHSDPQFLQRTMTKYGNMRTVRVQSEGGRNHLIFVSRDTIAAIQSNQGCQIGGPHEGRMMAPGGHCRPNAHDGLSILSLLLVVHKLCNVSGVCSQKNKRSLKLRFKNINNFF